MKAPSSIGSQNLTVQLPSGTKCQGGPSGNLCLVSFKTAGGFGNCVVVQQGPGTSSQSVAPTSTSTPNNTNTNSTCSDNNHSSGSNNNASGDSMYRKAVVDVRARVRVIRSQIPELLTDLVRDRVLGLHAHSASWIASDEGAVQLIDDLPIFNCHCNCDAFQFNMKPT
jgi:hypothetical protein